MTETKWTLKSKASAELLFCLFKNLWHFRYLRVHRCLKGTAVKDRVQLQKMKRKSLSFVSVVHKTSNWEISCRNCTVTGKRCTKSAVHEQSWKQLLFYILYTFSILLQNGEEIGMKKDRLFLLDETVVPASLTQLREVTSTITTQIVIFHFKIFIFSLVKEYLLSFKFQLVSLSI